MKKAIYLLIVLLGISAGSVHPQNISVGTGKNPMNGETWVTIEIRARQTYRSFTGTDELPMLGIQCSQSGKKRSFDIFVHTGILAESRYAATLMGTARGQRTFHQKLDDEKPRGRTWTVENDQRTYTYEGFGESGMNNYPPKRFLKDILSGKQLLIEFQPYEWNGDFTAEFNIQGLGDEFRKHEECQAK